MHDLGVFVLAKNFLTNLERCCDDLNTFEAFVIAAQLVADPRGTVYLEVSSLLHRHVEHAYHADGNHSGSDLVVLLFARLFGFFPFCVVHASLRWDLIYKLFD